MGGRSVGLHTDGIDNAALPKGNTNLEGGRVRLAGKRSALIDRGRWLFENVKDTRYGHWKESAYQGFRPEILDVVLEAYKVVEKEAVSDELDGKHLVETKRRFVSRIQDLVKPSRAREELEELAGA